MTNRRNQSSTTTRTAFGLVLITTTMALTSCTSDSATAPNSDKQANQSTHPERLSAGDLREKLIAEGFQCADTETEELEGRTLSKCEPGIMLAAYSSAEDADSAATMYAEDGKHVLRNDNWMVVDFEEKSRLNKYEAALGGETVTK